MGIDMKKADGCDVNRWPPLLYLLGILASEC